MVESALLETDGWSSSSMERARGVVGGSHEAYTAPIRHVAGSGALGDLRVENMRPCPGSARVFEDAAIDKHLRELGA